MPFASIHFIFFFLPAFLLLYYIVPFKVWRNSILLISSLVFFCWTDLTHLPQLIGFVLINYAFGLLIGHFIKLDQRRTGRVFLWAAISLNLLGLCFYKYLGFFGATIESIAQVKLNIPYFVLPLGISYLTFSGISYLLDIYNETSLPEKNLLRFSNYLIMFPKLTQGPITRFGQVKDNLVSPKRFDLALLMQGARRFISGMAKKVLLANSLAIVADKVFGSSMPLLGADLAWFGLVAFTLQIYFDFAGYTDMAIGLGNMFGFELPENFNYPYISRSITDFWRRWHMSLTSWFRTYLFTPLEFARRKEKMLRLQSNLLIVFLFTGLWHGASWNFVIWGVYFGLILAIEASGLGKRLSKIPAFFQHFYSVLLIMLGWIFFRLTDISQWGDYFKSLLGGNGWTGIENLRALNIVYYVPVALISILFVTPLFANLEKKFLSRFTKAGALVDLLYLGLFLLSVCYLLSNGFTAFMYAQY